MAVFRALGPGGSARWPKGKPVHRRGCDRLRARRDRDVIPLRPDAEKIVIMRREQVPGLPRRYDVERVFRVGEIVDSTIARAVNRRIGLLAAHGVIRPQEGERTTVHFHLAVERSEDAGTAAENLTLVDGL